MISDPFALSGRNTPGTRDCYLQTGTKIKDYNFLQRCNFWIQSPVSQKINFYEEDNPVSFADHRFSPGAFSKDH
jgi:hypothetical protein